MPSQSIEDRLRHLRPANDEPRLLHEFFERQVQQHSSRPAIECGGEVLSYGELDRQANAFAAVLQARGVGRNSLVALYAEKSCRLFVAMLGILKAGAGYVPLDPQFPVARVQGILEDAKVAALICDSDLASGLTGVPLIILQEIGAQPAPALQPVATMADDVCYVIYTSGSTGRPKGVVIEHRNAVNFVRSLRTVYRLTPQDRVYQGFSIAFDASVEEIWAALSIGGTLVVPASNIARSAIDAADFINDRKITYFSTVPPFLAMVRDGLPTVRLLVLGGDACPAELVHRWAVPGRRMLNTYGPTEATVVATAVDCVAGAPVTIGRALPGYVTYVLDDRMRPVTPGESGELYLGGASIARGYLNRPELTAERFIANPFEQGALAGRLYQTRDLVRLMPDGDLQFLGRADAQIKIRGFRIELSEIEAVLMERPSIRAAAVNAVEFGSLKELAAYVVIDCEASQFDRDGIADELRKRLPEYMVPRYLDVVDSLPQLTSGKVDRKLLPPPRSVLGRVNADIAPAESATERIIAEIWERVLQLSPISIDDDFFLDLRGHSLFAAQAVTELRQRLPGVPVSVPDLYEYRTVRRLARRIDGLETKPLPKTVQGEGMVSAADPPDRAPDRAPLSRFRWPCAALQLVGLLLFYGAVVAPVVVLLVLILQLLDGTIDFNQASYIGTIAGFLVWPSWLFLSIAMKWLVIGRYKPGFYPVWGFYYFRWWLVSRFQQLSLSGIFVGTPLMSLYYRAMGAKVGRHCLIETPHCVAFDLVTIGDGSSVGPETQLLGYRVENGWLILGNVTIGSGCFVGTHCCIGLDTKMESGARLADMSHLSDRTIIPADQGMRGSPAELAEVDLGLLQDCPEPPVRRGSAFFYGLVHLLLIYVMGYFLILSVAPAVALTGYALYSGGAWWGVTAAFASVPLSLVWYLTLVVLADRWVIGRLSPGLYRRYSKDYVRYWFLAYLLSNTRYIVIPLYATLYLPPFLRMLGAEIGRGVEISTVIQVVPELLAIGEGSFLADGCIVGGHRSFLGLVEIRRNKIGSRSFVGNSALVPVASDIGDNVLIGVMSTPPQGPKRTADGTRWLGSPSFELPRTQEATGFNDSDTYSPPWWRIALRALVEILRLVLPGTLIAGDLIVFCTAIVYGYGLLPLWALVPAGAAIALVSSFVTVGETAILKLLFMGRFKPIVKPLWSSYIWFNDVVNAIYETVAATAMAPMLGTPFISPCLRMMGCKVGKWVFLETTLFSEFDLVDIGDHAALNLGVTVQTHLFEDRVMKSDYLKIGDSCSVGNMAVVLYSTEMKPASSLDALSVLMKGEVLPAGSCWTGIPTKCATTSLATMRPRVAPVAVIAKPAPVPAPTVAEAPRREDVVRSRVDRLISSLAEQAHAQRHGQTPEQATQRQLEAV